MGRLALVFDTLDSDVETVARAAAHAHDLVLVSDARSPRVERLQAELGASLLVAAHRMVDSGLGLRHSDVELAGHLARAHAKDPLEAIVYAGDSIVDLGWHEPVLRAVPKGRLLNGMLASSRKILGSTTDFVAFGPTVVALAGDAATAEFVVSCNPTAEVPRWLPLEQVTVREPGRVERQGKVVDVRGLDPGETVAKLIEAAESNAGLIAAIGSSAEQGVAIQALAPQSVAGRVIYCDSSDWWMSELMDVAEIDREEPLFAGAIPGPRALPDMRIAAGDDMEGLGALLDELMTEGSDEAVVVTADDDMARDFAGTRSLLADLGFIASRRDPMGDLDPGRIRDDVILIGARARHAAQQAARMSTDLRALIHRLTEPSLVTSAVVGLVPGDESVETLHLRTTREPSDLGLRITPALLPVPNAPAQPHPPHPLPPEVIDPKTWVSQLKWGTRSRLALPWRWGLLSRAMKGRW